MKIVFQRQALEEYREAAIAYIQQHPDSNIRGRHGTLRRKVHRQSHWIVYRRLPSEPDTLEIIAIAHERRGEEFWEQRFEGM